MNNDLVNTTINAYDLNADIYSELRPLIPSVIKRLDRFIDLVKGLGNQSVLDVGCGPGRDSQYLQTQGLSVTGVDMSEKLLEFARKNVSTVDFKIMDMRKLEFDNESFGGLWINTSFLHIPKIDSLMTLSKFKRVLVKNGILFLGIQGHRNEKGIVTGKISETEMLVENPDFKGSSRLFVIYDEDEIKDLLNKSGFEVISIDTREEDETKIVWLNIFARRK